MIGLLPTTTIFLATAPTDLRKAYDGLAVLVRQSLGQDPLSGSLYVFCNRRRDRIKILFWEEGGYWLCARRLEEGTFRWPTLDGACARYRGRNSCCFWEESISSRPRSGSGIGEKPK